MIIGARAVLSPRKLYFCEKCNAAIDGPHVRLFGMANERDMPYAIRLHLTCAQLDEPRIHDAVHRAWMAIAQSTAID